MSYAQIVDEFDLATLLQIEPKAEDESKNAFLARILLALAKEDDKVWYTLPQRLRTWYNRCRQQLDRGESILPFPVYRKGKRSTELGYALRESATTELLKLLVKEPTITNAELAERLHLEGFAVSDATVQQTASVGRRVLRILAAQTIEAN